MDVYSRPELTDMVMCYGAAGGNGERALRMYQERFPNRNHPHHTILPAFINAFEKIGTFVPGALVQDRVKRGNLRLKKCLRELETTPQLAHVPLPMPWVQINLQCCESCKNKTYTHTTSRKYKDWGPTTSHLVFDLFSDFCNGAS